MNEYPVLRSILEPITCDVDAALSAFAGDDAMILAKLEEQAAGIPVKLRAEISADRYLAPSHPFVELIETAKSLGK